MKRTKIVCTIGPSSETKSKIEQMIKSGLNMARLNFSHGTYKHHTMLVNNIRSISKKLNKPVAILQDLQGPRIRIGDVAKEGIKVEKGQKISLVPENYKISLKDISTFIPIQYPQLYKDVKPGDIILIDDAKIELKVLKISGMAIQCLVKIGDVINSHKGMNFPKTEISTPAITQKDKEDLEFGLKQDVDFVALSFVKNAKDIVELRKEIYRLETKFHKRSKDFKKPKRDEIGPKTQTKIIAKIERPEAVSHFEEILKASDGIMVARGDLGLEVPLEDLPLIQKRIIRRCIQESKPVIVATQMLDSMIRYPVPTRAEVSDVANAILDGTDAIMLSGETATGKYPLKAVQVMNKIATEMENMEIKEHEKLEEELKTKIGGITETMSYASQDIAEEIQAKYIVCATTSGFTARCIAKYRSRVPIISVTPSVKTQNQLCLSWGVKSYYLPSFNNFNELISKVRKILLTEKLVKKGDKVLISAGYPFGYQGQTNLIKVETI
jgi:pyruvate kinase